MQVQISYASTVVKYWFLFIVPNGYCISIIRVFNWSLLNVMKISSSFKIYILSQECPTFISFSFFAELVCWLQYLNYSSQLILG